MTDFPTKRTKHRGYSARRKPKAARSFALLPAEVADAEKLITEGVCENTTGATARSEQQKVSRPKSVSGSPNS